MRNLTCSPSDRRPAVFAVLLSTLLFAGCASLPDNSGRSKSYAYTDTQDTALGRDFAMYRQKNAGKDGFLLLASGLDAFVARAALAESAERSLDVQYYLYHNDMIGHLFTAVLYRAAERGVRVRLLLDDMDLDGRDLSVIALDSHANIELRIFNPFDRSFSRLPQFVTGLGSVTRRMHNKSFTVDGVVSILGGRNIGDAYFDADPTLEFTDLDVIAVGDVVRDVSTAFDRYWNAAIVYPATTLITEEFDEAELQLKHEHLLGYIEENRDSEYIQSLKNSDLAQRLRNDSLKFYWGNAGLVVDDPEKVTNSRDATELHLTTQLAPYFEALESELIVVSPYFVPGREGVEFFRNLIDRGIRVKILTNSLASNDVGVVHAGYAKYRKTLLRAGVELYEMNKTLTRAQRKEKQGLGGSSTASLHAKTFVLDRERVFIGSLNLDPRSFYENTEIGLVIEQQEIAAGMAEVFDRDFSMTTFRLQLHGEGDDEKLLWHGIEDGEPVTYDVDPHTGFWRRFGVGFMSLLPIESQL